METRIQHGIGNKPAAAGYSATEPTASSSTDDGDTSRREEGPCNPDNETSSSSSLRMYSHTGSTVALCLCTLAHSYLLISVFPYAGFMAIDLIPGVDEENAGSYAGLIASMFMIGRALSSYAWGKVADVYGRTFVLYVSLISSGIFTLLFGLAPTFRMALFWRFCLGLGNGMVGTAKTAVSELAKGNQRLEAKGMGWVIAMWGWGFLISPALSGLLAEPVQQYGTFWSYACGLEAEESSSHASGCTMIRQFLSAYPFFLPNLVGSILCLSAFAAVYFCVEETLPKDQKRPIRHIPKDVVQKFGDTMSEISLACRKAFCRINASKNELLPLQTNEPCEEDNNNTNTKIEADEATMASIWARTNTRHHLLVYWASSMVVIAVDEIFPLFCMSQEAGLGVSESSIGKILSLSGLLFAIFQYPIYNLVVDKFGVYGSIRFGLFAAMPLICLIPATILLNRHSTTSSLTWSAWIFAGTILAIYRIFGLVFFSNITIATNRTVPAHVRASMNGFSMLGGSAVKGAGPFLAGCLFAFSVSSGTFPPGVSVVLPFILVSATGFVVAASSMALKGDPDPEGTKLEP